MLLAARDIVGGIEWVKSDKEDVSIAKAAEKEKKKFAGTELDGKSWESSVLVLSVLRWLMRQYSWEWRSMDMTLICLWTLPGI